MSKNYNVYDNNDLGFVQVKLYGVNVFIDGDAIVFYESRVDDPRAVFSLRSFSILEVTE